MLLTVPSGDFSFFVALLYLPSACRFVERRIRASALLLCRANLELYTLSRGIGRRLGVSRGAAAVRDHGSSLIRGDPLQGGCLGPLAC